MHEYTPPCLIPGLECPRYGDGPDPIIRNLCDDLATSIIEAGGTGLLENTICAYAALAKTRECEDIPEIREIRRKMGLEE